MTFSIFAFEMCNAKSIHTDMSRILLTIFCMWLPLQLMAQGLTVRGRVVDKLSRQPVAYANVSLYGNPGQGASTDSLGQFRIEHVAPGIYQLSVSCIGYKNLLSPEYIVSAKLPPVELELEEDASQLAEQSRALTLAWSALIVAVLLLALCVLLVVHHRRLQQKNRELVARIRSQEEAEQRAEEAARRAEAEQPADELSREMQLFRRLQALLADEEVLRRPRLGRDELADLLGTNPTYVADAVAACTEQRWSVSQYVAAVRVRRARYLIDNHPELSLGEIGHACGFQSQSSFIRCYRDHYGITPGEYRKFSSSRQ